MAAVLAEFRQKAPSMFGCHEVRVRVRPSVVRVRVRDSVRVRVRVRVEVGVGVGALVRALVRESLFRTPPQALP